MIKKTVTYDNFNDETVTEDFYFSISKLEALELEMGFDGGLEGHIKKLEETENGQEAYRLFKDVVLAAYGKKSLDGKRFVKTDADGKPLRDELEQSNALGELIFGFLENPAEGAKFIEGCLPAKLVAEAKAAAEKSDTSPELATAPPILEQATEGLDERPSTAEAILKTDGLTDEEILSKKPVELTKDQLLRAMHLKSSI